MGLIAGIMMAVASSLLTNYLGMQDDQDPLYEPQTLEARYNKLRRLPGSKSPPGLEPDWYWGEPSSPVRLRRVSGLQTQTIHEDEDEESEL